MAKSSRAWSALRKRTKRATKSSRAPDMAAAAPKEEESELAGHRTAIDALDREILASLNARAKHAQAIGQLKEGTAAYRPEREAQVLARLAAGNAGPLSNKAGAGGLPGITSACPGLEPKFKIASPGPARTVIHIPASHQP